MSEAPQAEGGLLATAQRTIRMLRSLVENRVELFLLELKEERLRLFDALLLFAAGVIFAGVALVLLTLTVVVVFWDGPRVLVLGLLTLLYALGAGVAFWSLKRRLQRWEAFSATFEQLKKDRACFETKN